MLEPVTFCPDPLSEPPSLRPSNQAWLALCLALSAVVHVCLGLGLPSAQSVAAAPAYEATEVFDIEPPAPPPPPPVLPDPPQPATTPEARPPAQPLQSPSPRPSPPAAPPALAAAVLTADDSAGPLDFTNEFVTGQGTAFSGGATSSRGVTSRSYVRSGAAVAAPASVPSPAARRDHSRRASVVGGFAWSCPFPPAADEAGIDLAVVELRIRVNAQGRLDQVGVLADPGHGFAQAARRCASGRQFLPALDRNGASVSSELAVRVRFTR